MRPTLHQKHDLNSSIQRAVHCDTSNGTKSPKELLNDMSARVRLENLLPSKERVVLRIRCNIHDWRALCPAFPCKLVRRLIHFRPPDASFGSHTATAIKITVSSATFCEVDFADHNAQQFFFLRVREKLEASFSWWSLLPRVPQTWGRNFVVTHAPPTRNVSYRFALWLSPFYYVFIQFLPFADCSLSSRTAFDVHHMPRRVHSSSLSTRPGPHRLLSLPQSLSSNFPSPPHILSPASPRFPTCPVPSSCCSSLLFAGKSSHRCSSSSSTVGFDSSYLFFSLSHTDQWADSPVGYLFWLFETAGLESFTVQSMWEGKKTRSPPTCSQKTKEAPRDIGKTFSLATR